MASALQIPYRFRYRWICRYFSWLHITSPPLEVKLFTFIKHFSCFFFKPAFDYLFIFKCTYCGWIAAVDLLRAFAVLARAVLSGGMLIDWLLRRREEWAWAACSVIHVLSPCESTRENAEFQISGVLEGAACPVPWDPEGELLQGRGCI